MDNLTFAPISVEESAYLAGFFDGEGSISMGRRGQNRSMFLRVSNTNINSLHRLQRAFGGKIYPENKGDMSRRRPIWKWYCASDAAVIALQAMLPFLGIKKEKALLALAFQEMKGSWSAKREEIADRFFSIH